MIFWIVITLLGLSVTGVIVRALLRGDAGAEPAAAYDLNIYRDQLKDVDRDLARGVLNPEEADRIRTEVSRRILAADAAMQDSQAKPHTPATNKAIAAITSLAVLGGAGFLYVQLGAPGYSDVPMNKRLAVSDTLRQDRLSQANAEARLPDLPASVPSDATEEFLELMEKLRETVAERPDDLQGLMLLARNEAALGRSKAAYDAQARILALKGEEATAQDHAFLADLMITAAGGYVSKDAETALRAALERDPNHPIARYYLAQYLMQVDRPDGAFRIMEQLLQDSPPEAPWVVSVRSQIEEVAWRAGVNYSLPAEGAAPGPDADAMAAAADMSEEDRQAMIEGMVTQLSERLASEGGSAEEWARLIRALAVLGDKDQARLIYAEAQSVFAGRDEELNLLHAAGRDAGVTE